MVKIKGPYDPVEQVCSDTVGHSMTQKQFKHECDINNILSKYTEYGYCEHVMNAEPRYLDCSSLTAKTFQEHLDFALDFEEHFDSLPQEVRDRFNDDPEEMMEFLSEEENYNEAVALGLLPKDASREEAKRSEATKGEASSQTPSLEATSREDSSV